MNALIDKFPTKIRIGEDIYEIDADFRNCLKIIMAYEDDELAMSDKCEILVRRLYKILPKDLETAIRRGIEFLNCGKPPKESSDPEKRVYSFSKDGQFIYSAIKQTYQVDLQQVEFLHWWEFVSLFTDVREECAFANIVRLRARRNEGKLTKEERKTFLKARDVLDINHNNQPTAEEEKFMRLLKGGKT